MEVTPAISTSPQKARRLIPKHGTPEGNGKRIVLVALSVLKREARYVELDDLKELVKVECARLHLAYDSTVVGRAAEAALACKRRGQL